MPTILVNGQAESVNVETVAQYIEASGLNAGALVVEYDGQVINAARWPRTLLGEGGRLELLNFVAGG